jgi:histidinol-phosphatase
VLELLCEHAPVSLPADLALALELADLADEITLSRFRAADLEVATKPDASPVTEADTAVERALRERLATARPGDAVLGEEYGDSGSADGQRRWILDPIDATMSYVRGIPTWGTLLALQQGEEVVVGVVSAPELHRRWWGMRGAGAFARDGLSEEPRQIRVSAISSLSDAQLCISAASEWEALGRLEAILELERRCWRTRGLGDLLSYMMVAEGVAEIGLDPVASLWDLAATQVIIEEAGGRFTDLAGVRTPDGGDAIATNGLLHDEVLAIVGR